VKAFKQELEEWKNTPFHYLWKSELEECQKHYWTHLRIVASNPTRGNSPQSKSASFLLLLYTGLPVPGLLDSSFLFLAVTGICPNVIHSGISNIHLTLYISGCVRPIKTLYISGCVRPIKEREDQVSWCALSKKERTSRLDSRALYAWKTVVFYISFLPSSSGKWNEPRVAKLMLQVSTHWNCRPN